MEFLDITNSEGPSETFVHVFTLSDCPDGLRVLNVIVLDTPLRIHWLTRRKARHATDPIGHPPVPSPVPPVHVAWSTRL